MLLLDIQKLAKDGSFTGKVRAVRQCLFSTSKLKGKEEHIKTQRARPSNVLRLARDVPKLTPELNKKPK